MSRYRRVKTSLHSDEKFRKLSRPQPNGQSVWQYLLYGDETTIIPGVIKAGRAGLAEALGWSQEGFDKAFQEVSEQGMAKADWDARLIWLPRGPCHNHPESPNVIIGWGKFWPEVPECQLKSEIFQGLKAFVEGLNEPFQKAFRQAFSKDLGESGTGTGTGTGEEGESPEGDPKQCPHQDIIDLYHAALPSAPRVRLWTDARKKFLTTRWREDRKRQNLEWWRKFFAYIAESDFLCGRCEPTGDRKGQPAFTADLEWIVRPNNFVKIIEGKYENRRRA